MGALPGGDQGGCSVDLYWIPLGAGGSVVRTNGIAYEAVTAAIQRRPRCDLYHSALEIVVPEGRFMVEMTPCPTAGGRRGVSSPKGRSEHERRCDVVRQPGTVAVHRLHELRRRHRDLVGPRRHPARTRSAVGASTYRYVDGGTHYLPGQHPTSGPQAFVTDGSRASTRAKDRSARLGASGGSVTVLG